LKRCVLIISKVYIAIGYIFFIQVLIKLWNKKLFYILMIIMNFNVNDKLIFFYIFFIFFQIPKPSLLTTIFRLQSFYDDWSWWGNESRKNLCVVTKPSFQILLCNLTSLKIISKKHN
jgi:hypothetical protein